MRTQGSWRTRWRRLRERHQLEHAALTGPELRRALVIEAQPDSLQDEVLAGLNAAMAASFEGVRFVAAQGESGW